MQECYAIIRPKPRRFFAILGVLGVMAVLFSTPWGSGLSPDSVTYIGAARTFLEGGGLGTPLPDGGIRPLAHYPPLFPLLLAGIGLIGVDPLEGARWLNAVLFGANIFLVGLAVHRHTSGSTWLSLFGCLLMLSSFNMLGIHSTAISEPLFLSFTVSGLLLLDHYLRQGRILSLIAAAVALAGALLTRYVGGAVALSGAIALGVLQRRPMSRRPRDLAAFLMVTCGPMTGWLARNAVVAGTLTDRQPAFHPLSLDQLSLARETLSRWFVPLKLNGTAETLVVSAALLTLLGVALFVTLVGRRRNQPSPPAGPYVWGLFSGCYLVSLLVSLQFFDAHTPLDQRVLSPLFVTGLIVVLHLLQRLLALAQRELPPVRTAMVILCAAFALSYAASGLIWIARTHRDGLGFASRQWKESELIAAINELPAETPIYSNGRDAIYILTSRSTYSIPFTAREGGASESERFAASVRAMHRTLESRRGVLIYFDRLTWRDYLATEAELREALPLELVKSAPDGSIYRLAP